MKPNIPIIKARGIMLLVGITLIVIGLIVISWKVLLDNQQFVIESTTDTVEQSEEIPVNSTTTGDQQTNQDENTPQEITN